MFHVYVTIELWIQHPHQNLCSSATPPSIPGASWIPGATWGPWLTQTVALQNYKHRTLVIIGRCWGNWCLHSPMSLLLWLGFGRSGHHGPICKAQNQPVWRDSRPLIGCWMTWCLCGWLEGQLWSGRSQEHERCLGQCSSDSATRVVRGIGHSACEADRRGSCLAHTLAIVAVHLILHGERIQLK